MDFSRAEGFMASVPAGILLIVSGVIVRPEIFYTRFVWKYLWGPVMADALGKASVTYHGVTAYPGYTLVSEIFYGVLLVYAVFILVKLLRHLGIGKNRKMVLYFVPSIISGGLLRVVEDAGLLPLPWKYLLISPVIYFTLSGTVLASILVGVALERRDLLPSYRVSVFWAGMLISGTLSVLLFLNMEAANPWIIPTTLGVSSSVLALIYALIRSSKVPANISYLTRPEALTVFFGHLVDASATSLSIDLLGYGEKHPVVEFFMEMTGTPYSFIPLKVLVVGGLLYTMRGLHEEEPVTYNLILLGVLSVGLGPGTRNLFRAVFGV